MKIIEFGVGNKIHKDVSICVDINKTILLQYKKKGYKILQWDLNKLPLPFEENSIDKIYAMDIFEHIEIDPTLLLKELYRILKPQCRVYIRVPNAYSWKNRILFLLGHLPDTFRPQHKRFFSFHYLDLLLRNAGFITKRNWLVYVSPLFLDIFKFRIEMHGEKQL